MALSVTPVAVVCTSCGDATSSVPAGWITDWDDMDAHGLVQCSHCSGLMVICQAIIPNYRGDVVGDGPPVVVWPGPDAPLSAVVPEAPRRSFEEARKCFRAGQYTASALMVRRTLEAVCADKGATASSLQAKLKDLESKKVIEGRLTEWSHDLRALGNNAAHDTSVFISSDDAHDALELAEALLSYVYVLNARYDAFKARRAAQANTAGAPTPVP